MTQAKTKPVAKPNPREQREAVERAETRASEEASTSNSREQREQNREGRIPMGAMRTRLQTPEIDGFHLHWFNDRNGRVQQAEQAGYVHVTNEELGVRSVGDRNVVPDVQDMGTTVSKSVGTDGNGHPILAYLMKQKMEWYLKDQAEKHRVVDGTEDNILVDEADDNRDPNTYGSVKISHK